MECPTPNRLEMGAEVQAAKVSLWTRHRPKLPRWAASVFFVSPLGLPDLTGLVSMVHVLSRSPTKAYGEGFAATVPYLRRGGTALLLRSLLRSQERSDVGTVQVGLM